MASIDELIEALTQAVRRWAADAVKKKPAARKEDKTDGGKEDKTTRADELRPAGKTTKGVSNKTTKAGGLVTKSDQLTADVARMVRDAFRRPVTKSRPSPRTGPATDTEAIRLYANDAGPAVGYPVRSTGPGKSRSAPPRDPAASELAADVFRAIYGGDGGAPKAGYKPERKERTE